MIKTEIVEKAVEVRRKYCDVCGKEITIGLRCSVARCEYCKKDLCSECIGHEEETCGDYRIVYCDMCWDIGLKYRKETNKLSDEIEGLYDAWRSDCRNEDSSQARCSLMPVISFLPEFLDALLSGEKQQTTRKQNDRIKVDDVFSIYNQHYIHLLGKVEITEIYDIHPCDMSQKELDLWALDDGFSNFATARCWFEIRYGARWMHQWWTVIRWDGWKERYFESVVKLPKVI